jgi:hypothetical protein
MLSGLRRVSGLAPVCALKSAHDAGALGAALGLLVGVEAGPPDAVRTALKFK